MVACKRTALRGWLGARGATMVEYALVIIAIMFLAAVAFRTLGKSVRMNADEASSALIAR